VPSSFEVNGEQYIAVQAGWGIDAERMQSGINTLNNTKLVVPQGGTLMVFKLSK
jgi:alcohol dehydrogenase (cytochrome c)